MSNKLINMDENQKRNRDILKQNIFSNVKSDRDNPRKGREFENKVNIALNILHLLNLSFLN